MIHNSLNEKHVTIKTPKGLQLFEEASDGQEGYDSVGHSIVHRSAYQATTGDAVYIDDIPTRKGKS